MIPLELLINPTALATKHRLQKLITKSWCGSNKQGNMKGHIKHWEDLAEEYELKSVETDTCKEINSENFF